MLEQTVFSKTNTWSPGGTLSAQNDEAYAGAEMVQQARASVTIPGFVVFPRRTLFGATHHTAVDARVTSAQFPVLLATLCCWS